MKSLAHSMPRQVIRVLEILITQHAAPQFLRSNKGPEFVAQALQQWPLTRVSRPFTSTEE